jgi:hypothetical protein
MECVQFSSSPPSLAALCLRVSIHRPFFWHRAEAAVTLPSQITFFWED